ncbi:hypothetical protein [Leifsonia shinshuensis]|uniref:Uncharacterized protein n=1 Tax=Leifsonia shinshuensis TaxID=150026 RepID=A0A7G6YBL2_9MICO|nr:hypothetical protein [Leifsonia shinshuensis]QNE35877.1 hypothetical protein F1C12_12565 [Leifsonia shinshuensis]
MTDDEEIEPVPIFALTFEPSADPTFPTTGRYEVLTESGSRYVLDLDFELLTRIRGTEQPDDPEVAFPARLRDEGRTVRLLRVVRLEVGAPAVIDIESLGGPAVAFTRRMTTQVVSIRALKTTNGST